MKRMNIGELQRKLTAAARLQMQTTDDRVPYAFEKRIRHPVVRRLGARVVAGGGVLRDSGVGLRRSFVFHSGSGGQQQ